MTGSIPKSWGTGGADPRRQTELGVGHLFPRQYFLGTPRLCPASHCVHVRKVHSVSWFNQVSFLLSPKRQEPREVKRCPEESCPILSSAFSWGGGAVSLSFSPPVSHYYTLPSYKDPELTQDAFTLGQLLKYQIGLWPWERILPQICLVEMAGFQTNTPSWEIENLLYYINLNIWPIRVFPLLCWINIGAYVSVLLTV